MLLHRILLFSKSEFTFKENPAVLTIFGSCYVNVLCISYAWCDIVLQNSNLIMPTKLYNTLLHTIILQFTN